MEKNYKGYISKTRKIKVLNQGIISTLVYNTYSSIGYKGEYYIYPNHNPNSFEISVQTCGESDTFYSLFNDFTPMYFSVYVHADQLADHSQLFECVLKALTGYEMSCVEYLQAAEAVHDGVLFSPDASHYSRFLATAAQLDGKQCVKWMLEHQKSDKDTYNCLLPIADNYVNEGNSLANLDVPCGLIEKLGLDCIEPASRGDSQALYRLALLYKDCNHKEKAKELFMQLIRGRDALGYMGMSDLLYMDGIPFNQQVRDIFYHLKAADLGYTEAMFRCGAILTKSSPTNNGTPADWFKGFRYLQLAAEQKHVYAIFLLGRIYYQGSYVPKDLRKAEGCLSIAASHGITEASVLLRIVRNLKSTK